MAVAYGNLDNLYRIRGDLDQAEAMYRKSLAIDEALGHKEGMASDYGSLGNLYRIRGDLGQAKKMYRKSLDLFRAVGAAPQVEQIQGWLETLRSDQGTGDSRQGRPPDN